jgi:two-component system sensor histidine kinase AtoS
LTKILTMDGKLVRKRWYFAAAAFSLGLLYTTVLALLGVEVLVAGRNVALPVAALTELAFGAFGFLLGRAAEARSAEKRSIETLAAFQSRLLRAERLATVGQVASRIAHEVRNPLAIIRSMVQSLGETSETESPRRTCQQVLEEIDRLSRVTSSLVGLSRPLRPRIVEIDTREVVSRVEWLSRRLLDGRGVVLRVALGPEGARVRADPDLACQVLLGLVGNAAEATTEGGSIDLLCEEHADEVVFSVEDHGPGVPQEIRERVFEPFFTTKAGSAGLGLAVAREVAEAQGGRVALENSAGSGARFALHLPRAAPEAA